jgi:hypothetical protein
MRITPAGHLCQGLGVSPDRSICLRNPSTMTIWGWLVCMVLRNIDSTMLGGH